MCSFTSFVSIYTVLQELPDGQPLDRASIHHFISATAEMADRANEKVESYSAILRNQGIA